MHLQVSLRLARSRDATLRVSPGGKLRAAAQPGHPLHALTTYELARYRRELEHALTVLPEHVAVRELLQGKLAEVPAEQQGRTKIAATAG